MYCKHQADNARVVVNVLKAAGQLTFDAEDIIRNMERYSTQLSTDTQATDEQAKYAKECSKEIVKLLEGYRRRLNRAIEALEV